MNAWTCTTKYHQFKYKKIINDRTHIKLNFIHRSISDLVIPVWQHTNTNNFFLKGRTLAFKFPSHDPTDKPATVPPLQKHKHLKLNEHLEGGDEITNRSGLKLHLCTVTSSVSKRR